jgi:putative membrane protein
VTTLVVCIDRGSDSIERAEPPIVGREAVESLVTDVGITDPENSRVNCLLEALKVERDLESTGEEAIVGVVSSAGDTVSADRSIASQTDALVQDYDPDSAIVVVDSAEDERLVPIIESRIQVDAVDRVVVRQARDIESTYYLLKQFLADEQLRQTVLVPAGIALLVFPILWMVTGPAIAGGAITAVFGVFLLYKGLGIDDYVSTMPGQVRDALYSGQISLVTYVVGGGLALIGVFVGAIGVSQTTQNSVIILAMRFAFDAIPWLTIAALAASTGRLMDEIIRNERVRSAHLNLLFGAVALGLIIRGFSAYVLERAGVFKPFSVPPFEFGPVTVEGFVLPSGSRLALFIMAGILISLVRFTAYFSERNVEEELIDQ